MLRFPPRAKFPLAIAVAITVVAVVVSTSASQLFLTPPTTRISTTMGSHRSPGSLPVWVALEQGFFANEGLDVELVQFSTALLATQALMAGGVDFASSSAQGVLRLAADGGPALKLVHVTANNLPGFAQLVVRKDLTVSSIEDLKGKTLAVDGYGVACLECQSFLTVLEDNGFDLRRDVRIVTVAHPMMGASLEAGIIDAATMIQPYATLAINQGQGYPLADSGLGAHGDASVKLLGCALVASDGQGTISTWAPTEGYWTTETFVQQNPETVHKVARAIARASTWLMEPANEDARTEILVKYVGGLGDPRLFKAASKATLAYQAWKPYPDGYTDWPCLTHQIQVLQQEGLLAQMVDARQFVSLPWFTP